MYRKQACFMKDGLFDRLRLNYVRVLDIVQTKLILVPLRSLHRLPCTRSLPCMYAGSLTMPLWL